MLKDVLDQLGSLNLEEKRAVEEAARAAVARELGDQGAAAPESCPRCGCPSFVRKGRDRDGSQRWPCRGRGSTFSAKTMPPLGYSKLGPEVWSDYVSDMLSGASLKACVVCGANDLGDSFCGLAGRGRPTDAELAASLEGLGPCERVSTGGHSGYARVLPGLGAAAHEAGPSLGMVNALHQRLKRLLGRFAGVSTSRPGHYPAWFQWSEQGRRSGSRAARVLSGQAAAGSYKNTRAMLVSASQPFWEYWEGRAAVSTVV